MIEIIPAIDLRNGKCVRLYQGDYAHETIYGEDAVAMAQKLKTKARRACMSSIWTARATGFRPNFEIIKSIAQTLKIPVQTGGGLRDAKAIQRVLDVGVARCIIGTKAAQEPQWAQQMFAQFGSAIILGLDARDGKVSVAGWKEDSGLPAVHFAQTMQDFGCARIIFTDIARDGTLAGPNAIALREMANSVEIPIIASGGVHKATDVRILRNIPNIEGVIVGKAIYEGTTSVPELLRFAAERE